MGYTTEFEGEFRLSRPLTVPEYRKLHELANTRHGGDTRPDPKFPGYYCQWTVNEDATALVWDGGEKFYEYVDWMNYIIDNFLKPWGVTLSGTIHYQGEAIGDHGNLVIRDGKCVQVADTSVSGDLHNDLETYIDELETLAASPDFDNLGLSITSVLDRLKSISYGDKS